MCTLAGVQSMSTTTLPLRNRQFDIFSIFVPERGQKHGSNAFMSVEDCPHNPNMRLSAYDQLFFSKSDNRMLGNR